MGLNFQEEPTGDAERLESNIESSHPPLPQLVTTLVDNIALTQSCTVALQIFFRLRGPLQEFGQCSTRLGSSFS